MAVYVDDMNLPATVQNGPRVSHTSEWSHLFADTEDELHAFAGRLGLRRSYFQQGKPDWFPHYDVTRGMRFKALRLGAEPVSARDAAVIARERNTRQAPEASRADRAAMADQWAHEAGQAYRDGDTERAAQLVQAAAAADPARGELWERRRAQVLDRASRLPLAVQTATRLAAAGIGPDDPAYQRLCEHNRLRREAQAGADRQAASDPEAAL